MLVFADGMYLAFLAIVLFGAHQPVDLSLVASMAETAH